MFSKALVVFLVVTNVVYMECRPQPNDPATEVIKDQLLRSQAFSNLLQSIWQQIVAEYEIGTNSTGQQASNSPFSQSPLSGIGGFKGTLNSWEDQQVNVNRVKGILFNSETFNSLIHQIWKEMSQRVTSKPDTTSQPLLPVPPTDATLNIEAVKASIFNSESFNNLIRQIWLQISSETPISGHGETTKTAEQAAAINAKYSFGTEVIDYINGGYQMREEKRENGKLHGSYAYDNGHVYRTVRYEADDKGFRILSDQSVPSVMANQTRTGIAEVKTYRDGQKANYYVKSDGTTKHHGVGQALH